MAVRGSKLPDIDKELQAIVDRETDAFMHRLITAGKKEMKSARAKATQDWVASTGASGKMAKILNKATQHEAKFKKHRDGNVEIDFISYIESEGIDAKAEFPKLNKWRERHVVPWRYMGAF